MAATASAPLVAVQRDGEGGADGERVVAGDALRTQQPRARPSTSPSTRSSTISRPSPASSAAGEPSATTRPRCTIATRSQRRSASSR